MGKINQLLSILICQLIVLYRFLLSPFLGVNCRFFPSCSSYMLQSIKQNGLWLGLLQGIRRLAKCHPWCAGGYDPISKEK